ncbi:MAG: prolyl oligopeptidase family serine peptidase [Bacillota bacterium]
MEEFSPFDLFDFEFLSDPRLSPDGEAVVYVRHTLLPRDNTYRADLYLYRHDRPSPFTAGNSVDLHPRWSPDGKWVAFTSDRSIEGRDLGRQLWVMAADGGEARPLTRIESGVSSFVWSPTGDRLALVSRCDPARGLVEAAEEEATDDDTGDMSALFARYNADVRHITEIKYKFDGMGFLEGKRSHVGVIPFSPDGEPEVPITVTSGNYDHLSPGWSPDGGHLAVSACRVAEADAQVFSDIWLFAADGSGEPRRVTRGLGPAESPSWSPNGDAIAYVGHAREIGGGYDNSRLWVAEIGDIDAEEFELRDVTAGTDASLTSTAVTDMCLSSGTPRLTWSPDADEVFYVAAERGTVQMVRVNLDTGGVSFVTAGDRVVYDVDTLPELGLAVVASADAGNPGRISLLDLVPGGEGELSVGTFSDDVLDSGGQPSTERVIAESNGELLGDKCVHRPERFVVECGDEAQPVDCWFINPKGDGEGGKLPTVLHIHGGIMGMFNSSFYFEHQLLAAAGYGVLFCNPRGSSGYSESFRSAVDDGWGPVIYPDLMDVVEEAVERLPIDPDRLGVAGGSAGAEIDRGKAKIVPGEKVFARIRTKYER